jgi:hypothetical protein
VRVGASTDAAKLAATDLRTYLDALVKKIYEFRLVADDKQAQQALTRLYGQALALDKAIGSEKKLTIAGITRAQGQLLGLDASLDKISSKLAVGHVDIEDADAERRLAMLSVQLTALAAKLRDMKLGISDPGALAKIAQLRAAIAGLAGTVKTIDFRVGIEGISAAETEVMHLTRDMESLAQAIAPVENRLRGMGFWVTTLGRKVKIFGGVLPGMLSGIAVWHLLIDAIIEVGAVLIPATFALLAFGAAAVPTVEAIVKQMTNLKTVTEATGKAMYPLSGSFQRVADAVKPQVYQLFGDALTLINRKTGEFTQLATGAGHVLDTLAARATVAFGGSGMSMFLRNAVQDMATIGDIIANLFGTVGNLLKVVPGYAQILLGILDKVTKGIETLTGTGFVQGILRFGMQLHGAFVYAGVGATAGGALVRSGLRVIAGAVANAGLFLGRFGAAGTRAGAALGRFAFVAKQAAGLPWGWIVGVAALVGFLAYKILTAKDATQQWLSSLQQALMETPAVRGFTLLQKDQAVVAARLAFAQIDVGKAMQHVTETSAAAGKGYAAITTNVSTAQKHVGDLTAGLRQQQAEARLYTFRLGMLAAKYGSVAHAQGLLTAAGVTFREMMDKSREGLAHLLQKVNAMVQAFSAMGQRAGVLGSDLNALTIAGSDQVTAMGKLNQAWDNVIGIVSGGQNAFITFEQDIRSVNKAFNQTGGTGRNVTKTFADAAAAAKKSGISMDGLNAASLQLRSTWQQAFGGAAQLIDALRMMSSLSPGGFPSITRAIKDTLAQLMPLGKQTGATRAEMVSLAQEVNPNITNFKQLTAWLGHTHDAGKDLNKILEKAGIDIQDLTKDAARLSEALTSQVTSAFAAARLKATGVDDAIRRLAADMTNPHTWGTIHADQQRLYDDLRKTGMGAKGAAALVSTLGGQLFRLPKNVGTKIGVRGLGAWKIQAQGQSLPGGWPGGVGAQKGWRVPGWGGGDRHPALLEGGEAVIDKHRTRMLAPLFAAMGVPGFAIGGLVPHSLNVRGLGQWAVSNEERTAYGQDVSLRNTMVQAINLLIAKARRTPGGGGGGALGGDAAANKALAARMFPFGASQWVPFVSLEMAEAGFNRFARNPFSGAYGIPQALPPTKMPFSAQAAGGSHAGSQLGWMFAYISSRWGSPANAWANELRNHWYKSGGLVPKTMDAGGWIPPGPTVMMNRTGRAEHLTPDTDHRVQVDITLTGGDAEFRRWLKKNIRINGGNAAVLGR